MQYEAFFVGRNIPVSGDPNLDAVAGCLMEPGPDTPRDLLDGLFLIIQMSTPAATESLLSEAQEQGFDLNANLSQTEIALRIWMKDPRALMQRHAELAMFKVRSFEYFSAVEDELTASVSESTLRALERSLDIWFKAKGRGTGSKVHIYPKSHEIWFLVRRGDLFRRQATLDNGQSGSIGSGARIRMGSACAQKKSGPLVESLAPFHENDGFGRPLAAWDTEHIHPRTPKKVCL